MTIIIPHESNLDQATGAIEGLDRLLTGTEIAALFRVNPRQPAEWARQNLIKSVRTPGGHHRYRESDVRALLADEPVEGVSA